MLEYLINGANVVFLAGCVYAAYLVLLANPVRMRISPGTSKAPTSPSEHELLFRNPCADYYI